MAKRITSNYSLYKKLRGPECMYAETEKYLLSKENNTEYKTEPYFKSHKSDVEYM